MHDLSLKLYILRNHKNQKEFADKYGFKSVQQVSKMCVDGYLLIDGCLYSKRGELVESIKIKDAAKVIEGNG